VLLLWPRELGLTLQLAVTLSPLEASSSLWGPPWLPVKCRAAPHTPVVFPVCALLGRCSSCTSSPCVLQVVFADGTFIDGSTIELSCDGPLREPYAVFCQVPMPPPELLPCDGVHSAAAFCTQGILALAETPKATHPVPPHSLFLMCRSGQLVPQRVFLSCEAL
jgi:hypothetical protein